MVAREPGVITLDTVDFVLYRDRGGAYAWEEVSRSQAPATGTPEEQVMATKRTGFSRLAAQLDWSHGIGANFYRPGDHRLYSSDGPSGELPGMLVRPHAIRKVALTATSATVRDFFEFDGNLYAVNGGYVREITPTLNAETVAAARTDGIANGTAAGVYLSGETFTEASPRWYDGTSTKVFLGSAAGFLVTFDGTTWTQGSGAQAKRTRFALGQYDNGQRLWGTPPSSAAEAAVKNLPQAQNPLTEAQWSVSLPLANTTANPTAMVALQAEVLVAYDDGMVYKFDSTSGVPTPLTDYKNAMPHADSGRNMRLWNGVPVIPLAQGLFTYEDNNAGTSGQLTAIGPESMVGNRSVVRGFCTALCTTDPEWLYAALYNAALDASYVYKARRPLENEQAQVRLVWQPACPKVAGEKVTALHITLLGTNPILCIGTDDPAVHFVTLPRSGHDVFSDSNCRSYLSASTCDTPTFDGLMPTLNKTFWLVRLKTRQMSEAEYLKVYVQVDGSGDWVQAGTVTESPDAPVRLPGGTTGRTIAVRTEFYGTDNTLFPAVESVEVEYTPRGAPADWVQLQVYVAQSQLTPSGLERLGALDRVSFLKRIASEAIPFDVTTDDGRSFVAEIDGEAGVVAKKVEHAGAHAEPGYVVSFILNLYDDLTQHTPALYEISPYTEGTRVSYYDTSQS